MSAVLTRDVSAQEDTRGGDVASKDILTVLLNAPSAFYIAAPDGELSRCNLAAARLLGATSPAELLRVGANVFQWRESEADRRAYAALLERDHAREHIQTTLRTHDGAELCVEEHACRTIGGRIIGALAPCAEGGDADLLAALQDRRFHELYEHAAIGIYRSTRDGRPVFANPAFVRMMGYPSEEEWLNAAVNIEREWYVDPTRRNDFIEAIESAGRVVNFESEIYRHKTGETVWVSETARVVSDAVGRTLYYEGTIEDISVRKDIERQLAEAKSGAERANKLKSEFLANMSHELRTPLNGIIGGAQVILAKSPPSDIRQFAEVIQNSGEHLLNLLNDILDLSKVEAGHMSVNRREVDLPAFIERLGEEWRIPAERKGLRFAVETNADLPSCIQTDETRIRQIFSNLLSNAIKFTDAGGVMLRIGTFADDDGRAMLRFEVIDTGAGIPEESMESIFAPFVQVDGSSTRQHEGTGLGLTLCRKLARLLGGDITCVSAPGEGSTFTFTHPAPACAAAKPAAPFADKAKTPAETPSEPASEEGRTVIVLIVDDNDMNIQVTRALLEELGYSTDVARNGAEAVERARARDYAAIFMDVNMPVMSGVEATARIRATAGTRAKTPIVALTANAMAGDRERYLAAGMDAYLSKPVTTQALKTALADLSPRQA